MTWSAGDLAPAFDVALEAFGPQRLMFGSDWPVCLLAASYAEVAAVAHELVETLSESEQQRIFADNATEFYRLASRAAPA